MNAPELDPSNPDPDLDEHLRIMAARFAVQLNLANLNRIARQLDERASRSAAGLTPLDALEGLVDLAESLDLARAAAVREARMEGRTWAEVGQALGTTKQAAFQRFGERRRLADTPGGPVNEEFDFGPPLRDGPIDG